MIKKLFTYCFLAFFASFSQFVCAEQSPTIQTLPTTTTTNTPIAAGTNLFPVGAPARRPLVTPPPPSVDAKAKAAIIPSI